MFDLVLDVLLVADTTLRGVNLPGTRCMFLGPGQGIADVAQMAVDQQLTFLGIRILLIVTGFAEVEAQHPALLSSLLAAMEKIQRNVGYSNIILAAPVPSPTATRSQLKELFAFSKQIQVVCKHAARFQYTKTGLLFYGRGGMYANLLDSKGLTAQGVKVVTTQLMDRLNSA